MFMSTELESAPVRAEVDGEGLHEPFVRRGVENRFAPCALEIGIFPGTGVVVEVFGGSALFLIGSFTFVFEAQALFSVEG